jgi:hypothetical protein
MAVAPAVAVATAATANSTTIPSPYSSYHSPLPFRLLHTPLPPPKPATTLLLTIAAPSRRCIKTHSHSLSTIPIPPKHHQNPAQNHQNLTTHNPTNKPTNPSPPMSTNSSTSLLPNDQNSLQTSPKPPWARKLATPCRGTRSKPKLNPDALSREGDQWLTRRLATVV